MPYKNKADQAAAARRHYEANKEKMKARAIAHKAKKNAELREYLTEVKSKPCTDCGVSYPHYVMQFDHIGDDKEFNIGDSYNKGYALPRIQAEIAKCELVCSNCHAERTYRRRVDTLGLDVVE